MARIVACTPSDKVSSHGASCCALTSTFLIAFIQRQLKAVTCSIDPSRATESKAAAIEVIRCVSMLMSDASLHKGRGSKGPTSIYDMTSTVGQERQRATKEGATGEDS